MTRLQPTESQKYEINKIKELLKRNDINDFKLDIHALLHGITYYRLEIPIDHLTLNGFNHYYVISHIMHGKGKLVLIIGQRLGV